MVKSPPSPSRETLAVTLKNFKTLRYILFAIILFDFFSCQNFNKEAGKLFENELDKNLTFTKGQVERNLYQISIYEKERADMLKLEEVKNDIDFTKMLGDRFIHISDSIMSKKSYTDGDYKCLLEEYQKIENVYFDIKLPSEYHIQNLIVKNNYENSFYKDNIKILAKSMQIDVLLNKYMFTEILIERRLYESCAFKNMEIAPKSESLEKNIRIINLENENIQKLNRDIYVDKILCNGKVCNLKPIIHNSSIFGRIILDSLSTGNYEIKGFVKSYSNIGVGRIEKFKYEFKIE